MGARKHEAAEKLKAARKNLYFAKLNGVPSSPRKMRYVVDMVRGMEVNRALGVLRFSKKQAAADVEKLLRSAIANWENKNERKAEDGELYISKVFVDEGVTMKRMRPAPQGRGYRIRKRSNHVTLFVDADTYRFQTRQVEQKIIHQIAELAIIDKSLPAIMRVLGIQIDEIPTVESILMRQNFSVKN